MDTKLTSTLTLKTVAAATALALGSGAIAQDEGSLDQQRAEQGAQAQQQGAQAQQQGAQGQQQDVQAQQQGAPAQQQEGQQAQQTQALQDLVDQHDNLSMFVDALEQTGLADTVTEGQYTAFAPTDEAFEDMSRSMEELMMPENREELIELLRNHLVADQVDAERARQLGRALTVGGATLTLQESDGELTVNGASVADTDIRAGGLTVHTIDEVLQPTGQQQVAAGQQAGQGGQAGQGAQAGQSGQADQGAQAGQYPAFEEADTDSDGQINRVELAAIEGLSFATVDENQDGNIDRQEYMQATEQQPPGQAGAEAAGQEQQDDGGIFGGDSETETENQSGSSQDEEEGLLE